MRIPIVTRMTYYVGSDRFSFLLDLSRDDDCEKLIRTSRWASKEDVEVNLRRVTMEELDRLNSKEVQAG